MSDKPLIFEKEGFPTIKIYEEHFEIKAVDFWEFRDFKYSDLKYLKHYNPNEKWWMKLYIMTSISAQIFSTDDPWILKIIKHNGGDWSYKTTHKSNSDFKKILKLIKIKASLKSF